ncbi:hypothetical protein Q7C11_03260, partial [Acinetobacter schindleri]
MHHSKIEIAAGKLKDKDAEHHIKRKDEMNFCHDHIRLKQTCLVSALALVYAQSSFALQEMSEDSMSESTG